MSLIDTPFTFTKRFGKEDFEQTLQNESIIECTLPGIIQLQYCDIYLNSELYPRNSFT